LRYAVLLKKSVFSEGYDDLSRVYILSDQLLDGHSGFSLYVQPPGWQFSWYERSLWRE